MGTQGYSSYPQQQQQPFQQQQLFLQQQQALQQQQPFQQQQQQPGGFSSAATSSTQQPSTSRGFDQPTVPGVGVSSERAQTVGKQQKLSDSWKKSRMGKKKKSSSSACPSMTGVSSAMLTAGLAGLAGSVLFHKANKISPTSAELIGRPQGALPRFAQCRPMSWMDARYEDKWTWDTYYDNTSKEKWASEKI
jgi:hypothetical protein